MAITSKITFQEVETLEKHYETFKGKIINICNKHSVPNFANTVNLIKDVTNIQLYINNMGSYITNTNDEKAHNEILSTFRKDYEF